MKTTSTKPHFRRGLLTVLTADSQSLDTFVGWVVFVDSVAVAGGRTIEAAWRMYEAEQRYKSLRGLC